MCCHCHNVLQTGLSFKDFLPLLGTTLVVFFGYYGISVQIKKNRRERWIEEFRKVAGDFISILEINVPNLSAVMEDILKSNNRLGLFLDPQNPIHQELGKASQEFLQYALHFPTTPPNTLDWERARQLLGVIKTKANKIIITELEKNNKIFI